MTAINLTTQIPSQINTLEKLHSWSGLCLAYLYPDVTALEGVGYQERVASANLFYIAADNRHRIITRASMQMSPDFKAGGQKLWNYTVELGNTAIPTIFTAN